MNIQRKIAVGLAMFFAGCLFAQTGTFDSLYCFTEIQQSSSVQSYRGGYLVSGGGGGQDGYHSYDLVTDSSGRIIQLVDSVTPQSAYARAVIPTRDGGFLSADDFSDQVPIGLHFRKYDGFGNLMWVTRLGPTMYNSFVQAIESSDGGIVALCQIKPLTSTAQRAWLVKISETGDSLWSRMLDSTTAFYNSGSLCELSNGHLVISIWGSSGHEMIETQSDGSSPIITAYTGYTPAQNRAFALAANDTIVIAGSKVIGGENRLILRKLDLNGNLTGEDTIAPPDSTTLYNVLCIEPVADDGYIVGAELSMSNAICSWIVRTDKQGNILWQKLLARAGSNGHPENHIADLRYCPSDNAFIIAGYYASFDTLASVLHTAITLTKLDSSGNAAVPVLLFPSEQSLVFPNPSSGVFTVTIPQAPADGWLVLTDLQGREIRRLTLAPPNSAGYSVTTVDTLSLQQGTYCCYVITNNQRRNIGKCIYVPR